MLRHWRLPQTHSQCIAPLDWFRRGFDLPAAISPPVIDELRRCATTHNAVPRQQTSHRRRV